MSQLIDGLQTLPGARLVGDLSTQQILRVHSDTRSLRPGDLFVALRGERFDGNDCLAEAQAAGAVAALAERGLAAAGLPGVEVPDSRIALGQLARWWRAQFDLPVVAVTGSNGKTTVTQMVAAILRAAAPGASLATQGNFNNDIGVPLTLLRLQAGHRLAVVELGMNHPGEIDGLAAMTRPTVALVNNAQREHQEHMGTVEAVARENAACFAHLPPSGTAVFPANDTYSTLWRTLAGTRDVLTFGETPAPASGQACPDVHGQAVWQQGAWALQAQSPQGAFSTRLQIAGRHNVRNALAAAACALAAGVSLAAVEEGLGQFLPVQGRSRASTLNVNGCAITLVDDSYNANPDSVRAAIDVLAELPGPRLLLLGDMGEVGEQGLAFHDEVLRHALANGIERLWVTGPWMAQASAPLADVSAGRLRCWADFDALTQAACAEVDQASSVLVKGSRFMRMERLVQALERLASPTPPPQEGAHHAA